MVKLSHLLILIADQLKLLEGAIKLNQDKVLRQGSVTLLDTVQKTREYCQEQRIDYVHAEVEWIIDAIFKNPFLKKELTSFALRLTPLKNQLGEFILTITLQDDRKKLSSLLLSVEHDLEEMKEKSAGDKLLIRKIDNFFSLAAEARKDLEKAIPQEKELEIMHRFSSMCAVIRAILLNLRSNERLENSLPMQALRKVLLHDWNILISLLKDKFEDIYKQKIKPQGAFLSSKKEGAVGFEMM